MTRGQTEETRGKEEVLLPPFPLKKENGRAEVEKLLECDFLSTVEIKASSPLKGVRSKQSNGVL